MNARDRLESIVAKRKRRPEMPGWLESLTPDQREAFDEAISAYVDIRVSGSKLGIPALVEIIEQDCGRRWSVHVVRDYLDSAYGDVWRA